MKYHIGPELDEKIAVEILGEPRPNDTHAPHFDPLNKGAWTCFPEYEAGDECRWEPLPFSSDMTLAHQVIEAMLRRLAGPNGNLEAFVEMREGRFRGTAMASCGFRQGATRKVVEHGTTLPHAICLAALEAKEFFL